MGGIVIQGGVQTIRPWRVYIAAPLTERETALAFGDLLCVSYGEDQSSFHVSSTWHDSSFSTVSEESLMRKEERRARARQCHFEIKTSDIFVHIYRPDSGREGNIVELGIAIGMERPIFVFSPYEPRNIFMDIDHVVGWSDSSKDLIGQMLLFAEKERRDRMFRSLIDSFPAGPLPFKDPR